MQERKDDFQVRRKHLADLSEKQLEERFWQLADALTQPLIDTAYRHTSPSIERSVLLRMGISSIEAAAIVEKALDHELLGKGAGHIVYRIAKEQDISIGEAAAALAAGNFWKEARAIWK